MMCSLPSRPAAWLVSTSFTSPMIETFCKGWTTKRAKMFSVESVSIARLACESGALIHSEVCRSPDEPIIKEPKIIQPESLSIQSQRH